MNQHSLFNDRSPDFAEVILPLPLPNTFTYRIPAGAPAAIGSRVLVQFGKKRVLTAVIREIHQTPPELYEAKEIIEVLDETPLITAVQLNLINWIASYYMCTQGEVLNAAIPSGLKLNSESKIQLNPDPSPYPDIPIDPVEQVILDTIARLGEVSFNELPKRCGITRILPYIRSLIEKRKIILFEEVKEKYRPKTVSRIRLHEKYHSKDAIKGLFDFLKNKPRQTDIVLKLLSLNPSYSSETFYKGVDKNGFKILIDSDTSLRALIREGILDEFQEIIPRFPDLPHEPGNQHPLSPAQQKARNAIVSHFETSDTVLLHGLTGSGKTEIYINLIHQALEGGSQVLFLLPEIALTTQIVTRLKRAFGNELGVYHSKFSDNERVEVYRSLLSGKYNLIVGVRSAVFLPFENLGLIIIDEEHETSYKQQDPAPRYHARDTALMLARLHNAKTLMGTATPSIESYYQCKSGNWKLVELTERYASATLPDIHLIDLRKERKQKSLRNDFSNALLLQIEETLTREEQVILFQNRRGYSPFLTCEDCAYVFYCKNCDVSMTYHMRSEELRCHYCGHTEEVAHACPACGSSKIKTTGFGTEKLEDDLKLFLPDARLSRMDMDTTRRKNSYQEIINDFEQRKTDILIGTQMVTKGLDFDNVSLVGIFDTDRSLHFPDFRAHERAFQVLTQVSGRAGRKDKRGKVFIQTNFPEHKIFRLIIENDYISMYNHEIEERERFFYPPFSRMIRLMIKDPKPEQSKKCADALFAHLAGVIGKQRLLGPEIPLINKIRNLYLVSIYIKLEREGINLSKAKELIQKELVRTMARDFKSTIISIDVDPV